MYDFTNPNSRFEKIRPMYDFVSFEKVENDLVICFDTGAQRHISFCLTLANSFDQGM